MTVIHAIACSTGYPGNASTIDRFGCVGTER